MAYPASVSFKAQKKSSSLMALFTIIPVKVIMLIPHFIAQAVVALAAMFLGLLGILAVLFFGEYPKNFEKIVVGAMQWKQRISAYFFGMTDKYPPFSLDPNAYALSFNFSHQKKNSRLMALLTIVPLKLILVIPHLIVLMVMGWLMVMSYVVGLFAVLFTGKFPTPLEHVVVATLNYAFRVNAYVLCLTDKYPPLSWE